MSINNNYVSCCLNFLYNVYINVRKETFLEVVSPGDKDHLCSTVQRKAGMANLNRFCSDGVSGTSKHRVLLATVEKQYGVVNVISTQHQRPRDMGNVKSSVSLLIFQLSFT